MFFVLSEMSSGDSAATRRRRRVSAGRLVSTKAISDVSILISEYFIDNIGTTAFR